MQYFRTGSVVFDIETIPTQNCKHIARLKEEFDKTFKVSGSLNKQKLVDLIDPKGLEHNKDLMSLSQNELIKMYEPIAAETQFDKVYRNTSFDGGLGEIISIAWMDLDRQEPFCITRSLDQSEAQLLIDFSEGINGVRCDGNRCKDIYFIGHNIAQFDLKFMWKRFVVNNVAPSFKLRINGYHGKDFYDTMLGWDGKSYGSKNKRSLDFICNALGIEGKGELERSQRRR